MSKNITCGIVYRIKNTNTFLIGHATKTKVWSIPKGIKDDTDKDESFSACRELKEETSLILNPEDLTFIGNFAYTNKKDMSLFYYEVDKENAADIEGLFCTSSFAYNYTTKNGYNKVALLPEIDKYKYIDIKDCKLYCNAKMCEILELNIKWF